MPRIISAWAAVAVLLAGLAWLVGGPATAAGAADPITACTTTTGVIVAVDFGPWGGNVDRGCDATLTTGYDALRAAGFSTAGDLHDGPAFICRIDNEPPPSQDPCTDTPPANATWWYWHANAGQASWSLSELGAMTYHPQPGSVDAWTFGAMTPPPFPPSQVRATIPGPPITTTTTTRPATTITRPATTTIPPTAPPPAVAATPTTAAAPSPSNPAATSRGPSSALNDAPTSAKGNPTAPLTIAPATKKGSHVGAATTTSTVAKRPKPSPSGPSPAVATSDTTDPSSPKIVDVAPQAVGAAAPKGSGGSLTPTLIGVSVVGVLAAAGGITAWRRRRRTG